MPTSRTESVWMSDGALPHFPTLDHVDADVLIVGGGISGLTTGILLQRAGYRTAILEQDHLGSGETGRTSAHVTEFLDLGFARLIDTVGLDAARTVAQSKREAMRQIEQLAREMSCDFEAVPGYLYTEDNGELDRLRAEFAAARELGVDAQMLDRAPVPFNTVGAVEFPKQAQIHPLKYLHGLIRLYAEEGGTISELTHVRAVDESGDVCYVRTDRTTLHCRQVVTVTDAPIAGGTLLDTKLRANRSYVIALSAPDVPLAKALFWDTDDPYHYIRSIQTAEGPLLVIGGEDERVGTSADAEAFQRLEQFAAARVGTAQVVKRWSGQIMEPLDGLPYIGPHEENSRVLVATGYAGNGLTFGTLAAQILVDAIGGRVNPYAALYSPTRVLGARQWAKYAAQNLPAAWTLVTDMLPLPVLATADDLEPGDGRVLRIGGEKAAAARDRDGVLHIVSPTCTHMGCEVVWNRVEETWDCPCHGSRYDIDGTVVHGPAMAPLEGLTAAVGKRRE